MERGSHLIRNLVFVGTTGMGKSSTCQSFLSHVGGKKQFKISDRSISETKVFDKALISKCPEAPWQFYVVDSPGFADSAMDDETYAKLITGLADFIKDSSGKSSNAADAYILVTKLTPKASALKNDLEQMLLYFGRKAVKSTLVLIIDQEQRPFSKILGELEKDGGGFNKILADAKGEPGFNPEWFTYWDNKRPYADQYGDFFEKISKFKSFTYEEYEASKGEIKAHNHKKLHDKQELELKRINREYDGKEKEKEIKDNKEKYDKLHKFMDDVLDAAWSGLKAIVNAFLLAVGHGMVALCQIF